VSYCESVVAGGIRLGRDDGNTIAQKPVDYFLVFRLRLEQKKEEEEEEQEMIDHAL
jgi:hypothetical protein